MKFVSSLIATSLLLGASVAYAGSDDGSRDTQGLIQAAAVPAAVAQAPAPAPAAAAQKADDYSRFEHQVVQP